MNLDELVDTWRKQDSYVSENLKIRTMHYLFKERSKHALSKISRSLVKELILIVFVLMIFDGLYFLVNLPFSTVRWICFVVFNLIALLYIIYYQKMIYQSRLEYSDSLEVNLQRITKSLTQFRRVYLLSNLPVIVICFVMFGGANNLLFLVPWMIFEALLLRWALQPRLGPRFEDYKADLEYTLRSVRDVK